MPGRPPPYYGPAELQPAEGVEWSTFCVPFIGWSIYAAFRDGSTNWMIAAIVGIILEVLIIRGHRKHNRARRYWMEQILIFEPKMKDLIHLPCSQEYRQVFKDGLWTNFLLWYNAQQKRASQKKAAAPPQGTLSLPSTDAGRLSLPNSNREIDSP